MSIQEHLNKIRNAVYGHEVRESIAKGIETAYDDASEKYNANMEVKVARGTHPNLRSRLEEVDNKQQQITAQLQQKAKQSELEATGKRVDTLVLASGNANVEVTDAHVSVAKNKTFTTLRNRFEEIEVATDFSATNINSDAVAWSASAGTVMTRTGDDITLTGNGTEINPRVFKNTQYAMKAGHKYYVKTDVVPLNSDVLWIYTEFYSTTGVSFQRIDKDLYVQGVPFRLSSIFTSSTDDTLSYRFVTEYKDAVTSNGKQVTFSDMFILDLTEIFGVGKEPDITKLEQILSKYPNSRFKGTAADFITMKDVYNKTVDVKGEIVKVAGLFNGIYNKSFIVSSNEAVNTLWNEPEKASDYRTAVAEIGSGFHSIRVVGNHDTFNVAFSNSLAIGSPLQRLHTRKRPVSQMELTVNNTGNYRYLLITVSTTAQEPKTYVYQGDALPKNNIPLMAQGEELLVAGKPLDLTLSEHRRYSRFYQVDSIQPFVPSTYQVMYGYFDALMSNHTGYITRNLEGADAFGNSIYSYNFSKPNVANDVGMKRIKVGILSGLHGNEKNPALGVFKFMEDLANNVHQNETLDRMKSLIDFSVIPCANPTGWNADTRENHNGVNLNRNFTTNWKPTAETDSNSGTAPASEEETKVIEAWMADGNFDFFIDFHNTDQTGTTLSWLAANPQTDAGKFMKERYFKTISTLSLLWSKRFSTFPKNTIFGHTNAYDLLAQSYIHADSLGIKSALIETVWMATYIDSVNNEEGSNIIATELLGNYLLEILKDEID